MTARHGGLANGHGPMATPIRLDATPHSQALERSDSAYSSTRVGPVSVQSQVLYTGTADWLLDVPDGHVDSGFCSTASEIEPDRGYIPTIPDAQCSQGSSHLSHLETTEWPNVSPDVGPWFPGSRVCPPRLSTSFVSLTLVIDQSSPQCRCKPTTSVEPISHRGIIRGLQPRCARAWASSLRRLQRRYILFLDRLPISRYHIAD